MCGVCCVVLCCVVSCGVVVEAGGAGGATSGEAGSEQV